MTTISARRRRIVMCPLCGAKFAGRKQASAHLATACPVRRYR